MTSAHALTSSDRSALDAAIRKAEQSSRAEFSVFVGLSRGEPRAFARRLHASLAAPDRSILIMVDPRARAVEVVTGGYVRRTLVDSQVDLAVEAMTRSFAEGDLGGGLRRAVYQLAEHARAPHTRHAGAE